MFRRPKVEMNLLNKLSVFHQALLSDLELKPVLRNLLTATIETLDVDHASVFLYHPEENDLRGEVGSGRNQRYTISTVVLPLSNSGPVQQAFFSESEGLSFKGELLLPIYQHGSPQGGVPFCWADPARRCNLMPQVTLEQRPYACPKCGHFGVLGVLALDGLEANSTYQPLFPILTQLTAMAIQNARLYEASQANEEELAIKGALLSAERKKLTQALEQMADAVVVLEGYLGFANKNAQKVLKVGAQLVLNDLPAQVFPALEGQHLELAINDHHYSVVATRDGNLVVLILHDITERKHAEERQFEAAARYQGILESSLDGIITIDWYGNVIDFSPSAERLFGFAKTEALGQPLTELIVPERFRRTVSSIGQQWRLSQRTEIIACRFDGSEFPLELTISPVQLSSQTLFTAHVRDISDRLKAEESIRSQGDFLAALADITQNSLESTDMNEMLSMLVTRMQKLFSADSAQITLWDETNMRPIPAASSGMDPEAYHAVRAEPHEPTFTDYALRLGKTVAIRDVFKSQYVSPRIAKKFSARSVLVLPLIASGKKIGALIIGYLQQRDFDETELQRAEQARSLVALSLYKMQLLDSIQKREAWFRALLENNQDVIYVIGPSSNVYYASPNAKAVLGYNPDGHYIEPVFGFDYIFPDDREQAHQILMDLMKQRDITLMTELRIITATGAVRWAEFWGRNMLHDPAVGGLVINLRDITSRKEAERALQQSEATNRAILRALPDMLFVMDNEGVIKNYNAARDQLWVTSGNFTNQSVKEFMPPQVSEKIMQAVENTLQNQSMSRIEYDLEVLGSHRFYEARFAQSGEHEVLAVVRDVTDQKNLDSMKREFTAAVSHELRTPLVGIMGFTDLMLSDSRLDEESMEFVQIIHDSGLRLKNMVDNLLDTSRLEAGRFEVNRRDVDLSAILHQTVDGFRGVARLSNVDFDTKISDLPKVYADPDRVGQVVGNILANAFKFTPKSGRVQVRAYADSENVHIEVQDSGPGIPPDQHAKLFQRYGRTSTSVERGVSGTGLGLYISKAIIDAHGGQIFALSEPGKGATFNILLPNQPHKIEA